LWGPACAPGENIGSGDGLLAFTGRWSDRKKHHIVESRCGCPRVCVAAAAAGAFSRMRRGPCKGHCASRPDTRCKTVALLRLSAPGRCVLALTHIAWVGVCEGGCGGKRKAARKWAPLRRAHGWLPLALPTGAPLCAPPCPPSAPPPPGAALAPC
jgi:hypothetical protein